jgi:hypothetical protein
MMGVPSSEITSAAAKELTLLGTVTSNKALGSDGHIVLSACYSRWAHVQGSYLQTVKLSVQVWQFFNFIRMDEVMVT